MLSSLILALLLVQAPAAAQEVPPIRNFLKVTPDFCTGGQPRVQHFAQLKADGVRAVLNLRQPTEHRADEERGAVEQAGLKYFNVPVNFQEPSAAAVDEFHGGGSSRRALDDPARTSGRHDGGRGARGSPQGRPRRGATPRGIRPRVHPDAPEVTPSLGPSRR
jgi:hypothetical protein